MAALLGAGIFAGPASAHTGAWSVTCDSVTVHLQDYNKNVTNTVALSVDSGDVLVPQRTFGGTYDYTGALPAHDAPIGLHLVVKAGDGRRFSLDEHKTAPACEKPTSPPPTTTVPPPPTTTATTPAPPTTTSPAPTPTTTSPVVAGATSPPAGGGLAETGSSSATPMIAGIAVAAVVVGGGALVFARRRRSSSHR